MTDYTIQQGATFRALFIWFQPALIVKAITGISQSVKPSATVASHGIPAGIDCPVWIRGVKGCVKLNHSAEQVGDTSVAYVATRADDNSVSLSADTVDMPAYASGGELVYQPPVDLTGCTARMDVRRRLADVATVLSLTSSGVAPASRLTITPAAGRIDIEISDEDTALIDWKTAVWDLEVEHPDGSVTRLVDGASFSVSREVTRP